MAIEMIVEHQSWPIAGSFAISRGAKTTSEVVVVTLKQDGKVGQGECVPYARYGETIESVQAQIETICPQLTDDITIAQVQTLLPAGAARNAVDCALHDLFAKREGCRIWDRLSIAAPEPAVTAYTLSLSSPDEMAAAAKKHADRPVLKVKLGGEGDDARMRAVRSGAPDSTLIVDANEAWDDDNIEMLLQVAAETGVAMIEQPLHAKNDEKLSKIAHPVPICADEACHDRNGLADLKDRYDMVNIKLDKTGGITEALAMAEAARSFGFRIMVGCMLGTSLGMAPALLLQPYSEFLDLDGPLLLAKDRSNGLHFSSDGSIHPPAPELWG